MARKFLNGIHISGTTQIDFMPTHESEGILTLGRFDSNTSRYHNIKSYVSSTEASNYLKFSLHAGTENAVVDVLTLKGNKDALFSGNIQATSYIQSDNNFLAKGDIKFRNNADTSWNGGQIGTDANDALRFAVRTSSSSNVQALSIAYNTLAATFAGDVTMSKAAPTLEISSTSGGTAAIILGRTADTKARIKAGDALAGDLTFSTGGSRRIQIASGGGITFNNSLTATDATFAGAVNVKTDKVQIDQDGTYGSGYGTVGFGGKANGSNRVFGATGTGDGLFLASATGRGVFIRTNGSGSDTHSFGSNGYVGMGIANTNNQRLTLAEADANGSHIKMNNSRSGGGYWVVGVGDTNSSSSIVDPGGLFFYNGTTKLKLNSSGNATFAGNVSLISSSTVNLRVTDGTQNIYVGSSGNTRFGLSSGASIIQSTSAPFGIGTQDGQNLTLGTDNTARLTVMSSGNIGIGTDSPSRQLTLSQSVSGETQQLLLVNRNDTNGDTSGILFGVLDNATYAKAGIFFERTDLQARGSLHFATDNSSDSGHATKSDARMSITTAGNVGIGTISPGARLDVNGATYVRNVVYGYAGAGNQYGGLSWAGTDEGFLFLKDSNVTKVIINSNGNSYLNGGSLGIGTTSPDRTLDVEGTGMAIFGTGDYTELMLRGQVEGTGTVRNVGAFHWSVRGDVGGDNDDLKLLRFVTGTYSGIAMQISNSNGNVGIGTSSPIQKLDTPNIVIGGSTIAGTYRANALFMDNNGGVSRFYSSGADGSTKGSYQFNIMASDANPLSTPLTLNADDSATFAGNITSTGTAITLDSAGSAGYIADRANDTSGATYEYKTNGSLKWYTGLRGVSTEDFYLFNNAQGSTALLINSSNNNATFAGKVTATQFKLNNNVNNTNADSFLVYSDGGSTSYGMTLWNTNATGGEWATMIFGPNQASRRISFGKANANFGTNHAGIDELAFLDLDNGNFHIDGAFYGDGSNLTGVTSTSSDPTKMPLAGGTMTGDIQFNEHSAKFNQSGVRSWDVSASSGNLNITSGDSLGNVAISSGLTVEDAATFAGNVYLGDALTDKAIVHGHLGIGDDTYPKIAYPGQNALFGGSGSTTGQIVIDLPGTLANFDMMYMEIDIYEYSGDAATKLIIGAHNWNSGGNSNTGTTQWYNPNVQVIGRLTKPVYLGRRNDGSNERRCIAIGETNSTWSYVTVHVAKVHGAEFYGTAIDWVGDWNIAQTTSGSYFTKNPTTNFNDSGTYTLESNGIIEGNHIYGSTSARSPIFYDLNNTGYYLHADNKSNLGSIKLNESLTGTSTGCAEIGRNHAYDTMELKGYGAEMMIGAQHTTININYRTCNDGASGHTPTDWYWRAGSASSFANLHMGMMSATTQARAPIYYDSANTAYYLDPNTTGLSLKVAGSIEHQGVVPTTGTNIDQIKEFTMSFQLAANTWTDTGIDGTDLTTGTYIMQVYVDDYNVAGGHYTEYYSATISWFSTNTNDSNVDEIIVHRAGHAPQTADIQFRTERTLNADSHDLMLQVKHNLAYNAALDNSAGKSMRFKFRRLI